jgi:hypothetical protein
MTPFKRRDFIKTSTLAGLAFTMPSFGLKNIHHFYHSIHWAFPIGHLKLSSILRLIMATISREIRVNLVLKE